VLTPVNRCALPCACASRLGTRFARRQYGLAGFAHDMTCGQPTDHRAIRDKWGTVMAESKKEVVVRKGEIEKAPSLLAKRWDEMDRMFEDFFGRSWLRPFGSWGRPLATELLPVLPKVDVVDRDEEVIVRAEVPGMEKEDLDVSISGNVLTLKGETCREEKEEKGDYYRCEMSHGAFARTLSLPAEVDESRVKASLKDGVLELKLPKVEKSRRRAIKID
jgi:HSP20 family protein